MERKLEPHDLLVAYLLVHNLLERRSEAFFQPFGLTGAQFNILNLLAAREGRMEQAAVVDLLLVGKSSISIVLNRMVRDGLVKREEHPKDRRQVVLVLTAKGRALWKKISPSYEAGVKQIFGALSPARRRQFLEDLKVLHDAFLAEEGSTESGDRWHSLFLFEGHGMLRILPSNRVERLRLSAMLLLFTILAFFFWSQFTFLITRIPVLYYYCRYFPQEGDVIFQSLPHGELVDAIEGITHSPYSHCGVVLRNDKNQWVVIESIYNVHETPLFLWELRGRGGDFAAYRLDPKYSPLVPRFKQDLLAYAGRLYDYDYDLTQDQTVYCSDLVYLAFDKSSGEKMGTPEKLGHLDWKPYEHFIETEQEGKLPLDRVMITPASLARAPQLHEAYRSGFYYVMKPTTKSVFYTEAALVSSPGAGSSGH